MKKKKELVIKIDHKLLYTFVVLGILVLIAVGVYAYGTSNPSTFGHSPSEIDFSQDFFIPSSITISGSMNVNGSILINNTPVYINAGCNPAQWGSIRKCYVYAVGESLESLCVCSRNTAHSPVWAYYPIVNFVG